MNVPVKAPIWKFRCMNVSVKSIRVSFWPDELSKSTGLIQENGVKSTPYKTVSYLVSVEEC